MSSTATQEVDLNSRRGETADALLRRPLPALLQSKGTGTTTDPSHNKMLRICPQFIEYWPTFERDMRARLSPYAETLKDAELLRQDAPETFFVSNKIGVQGRFVQNVCIPVTAALHILPGFNRYGKGNGDRQVGSRRNVGNSRASGILHGEIKTPGRDTH